METNTVLVDLDKYEGLLLSELKHKQLKSEAEAFILDLQTVINYLVTGEKDYDTTLVLGELNKIAKALNLKIDTSKDSIIVTR